MFLIRVIIRTHGLKKKKNSNNKEKRKEGSKMPFNSSVTVFLVHPYVNGHADRGTILHALDHVINLISKNYKCFVM